MMFVRQHFRNLLRLRLATGSGVPVALATLILGMHPGRARADNFANIRYDAHTQELVVTMAYRGTNPNHSFSLRWGKCEGADADGVRKIVAEVLDDQWQDKAEGDFKKTTRFNLADFKCRPAMVTLRTAPRFYYTIRIP